MLNTGRALIINDNKLLLVFRNNHGKTYFAVPGGKQDDNEPLEQTVVREVFEETCIRVTVETLLTSIINDRQDRNHNLFKANYIEGIPTLGNDIEMENMNKDPDNYYQPMWVSLESIKDIPIFPFELQDFVKNYIEKL